MPDLAASAMDKLKDDFADAQGFGPEAGADTDPEIAADPDLDDEITPDGDNNAEGDPGEPEPEGDATPAGQDTATAAEKKAEAAEVAALLGGEKLIKQGKGEFISKDAFLKRLRKESVKVKEFEAKLKPFLTKAAEYQHWDKFGKAYRENAQYVDKLRPIFQQDPWLAKIVEDRISGRPVDWAAITNSLKPFLAPFWEGAPDPVQTDPAVAALQRTEALEKQLTTWQTTQAQEKIRQAQEFQSQQTRQQNQQTFAASEKAVWKAHPKYNTPEYRDMLYDRAERIQAQMPEGTLVDLGKVAKELFGLFDNKEKERALTLQRARERTRRAAGEGSGGLPGSPILEKPDDGKPKDPRAATKAAILKRFGTKFDQ
jgi:hypothetical protein